MNEKFALEPALAKQPGELKWLLAMFGFYEGRFVEEFPNHWEKEARKAIEDLDDDNALKRAEVVLKRARDVGAFLPTDRPYSDDRPWVENALSAHATSRFSELIVAARRQDCLCIEDIDPGSLAGSRDMWIKGDCEAFMRALTPLLRTSSRLVLQDSFFKPWRENTKSLFIEVLKTAFKARCEEFHVWVDLKKWKDWPDKNPRNPQEEIEELLAPVPLAGKRVKIYVCEPGASQKLSGHKYHFHKRYLFSEWGGVEMDAGLQESRKEVIFSIIDREVHLNLKRLYFDRPPPYVHSEPFVFGSVV